MLNSIKLIEKENVEIKDEQSMGIKYIEEDIHELERKQRVYRDFSDLTGYRNVTRELRQRHRDLKIAKIIYFAASQEIL